MTRHADARDSTVLVCGAGFMGHGIAQVLAAAGYGARLYEPDRARAEAGRERIAANLERSVAKGRLSPEDRESQLRRVEVTDDLAAAAAAADLVIEAIVEDESAKRSLFTELDRHARSGVILATNTSSIAVTGLATALSPERRPHFVGVHFFSPVPVMPLIELVRGLETSDATERAVRDLAHRLAKQVIVSADRPGFIVNRILMPFLAEAMRAYEEGVGSAEDIDAGARVGLNHPMGPLELADFIGLDVCLGILEVLHDGFGAPHLAPPPVLRQLVAAGRLGQKSGRGFYAYPR